MGTLQKGLLCWHCRHIVPYSLKKRERTRILNGKQYNYVEFYGECNECHSEIAIPGLDEENENRFEALYRRQNGIITVLEIQTLLEKYDVEKRPLAHLLGYGEHTITRYLEGQMPKKEYSDKLLSILHDYSKMEETLEAGKNNISDVTYRKINNKINTMKALTLCTSKIEEAALYIANSVYDITDLSLQKLLYFVKGFSLGVFGGKTIFEDTCEAWPYGPVFPSVYKKYKRFGNALLPKFEEKEVSFSRLSEGDRKILDYVLHCYGRLNGSVLMEITHKEAPWQIARMGLEPGERSNNIISDEDIKDYYEDLNQKYSLNTETGVQKYIESVS